MNRGMGQNETVQIERNRTENQKKDILYEDAASTNKTEKKNRPTFAPVANNALDSLIKYDIYRKVLNFQEISAQRDCRPCGGAKPFPAANRKEY